MKKILKDAFKSDELQEHLQNVIAVDDCVEVEILSDDTIIREAKYVLSKYLGGLGFFHQEEYDGEHGKDQEKCAKKNVTAIKSFLKKYDSTGAVS
jgi:hypothetical protein